ncbi:MAG: RtcB family protein, partial [Myxococcales bacterium]|nr:RtcB family protein [Myxococcales bacterium]
RAVGLPDLHPGRGIPIGAAFAFAGVIEPALVGGDAGCGVRVVGVPRPRRGGDALGRRLDKATRGPALPHCDPQALLDAVWADGPAGLARVAGVPERLAALAEADPPADPAPPSGPVPPEITAHFAEQLGTAGGGNHFLEVAQVTSVEDPAAGRAGLVPHGVAVLAHSGSRGLGGVIGRAWAGQRLSDPEAQATYLGQLAGAVRFARANRLILAWRALEALGCARPDRIGGTFDVVHNDVQPWGLAGEAVWLHRKGAAPAEAGQLTVVLGSRGAPSVVMEGSGRADCLCSVAHGAGRRMGRSEAVAKLKPRFKRAELQRTALGGEVLCDDAELLYAEHPRAYKPVEPVVDSLVAAGLARPVARLVPRFTVKR